MSERSVQAQAPFSPSGAAVAGRIFLGGVLGALGGLVAGGVVYGSLVVGIFAAMGGAICGLIAAAASVETR